jgi:hypothetical protein
MGSFLLLVCFILLPGLQNTTAQTQVQVKLTQPPPNQLRSTDLWKLTLINTSRTAILIKLVGTLEEAGAGIIVNGTSPQLNLPPGAKTITYDDVKKGSVKFKSGKWQDAFTRTGNAPSGDYTICITVLDKSGQEIGKDCIEQKVEISGAIQLISPADGEEIAAGTMPNFTATINWGDGHPQGSIKIVEIRGDQSPDIAMNQNKTWFSNDKLKSTTFQYPLSAPKFIAGNKYAWMISVGESKSEVFSFKVTNDREKSMMGGANTDFKLDTIYCTGTGGGINSYHIKATYRNLNTSTNNILINDNLPFTGNSVAPAGNGFNLQNNIRTKTGTYNAGLLMLNILESNNGTISNITPAPIGFINWLVPGTGITFEFDFSTNASSTQFTFYGLVDDGLKGGTNKNPRNETLAINKFPDCPCDYCQDDMIRFNGANTITDANNILTLSTHVSIGNQITQFKAELIGFSYQPQNGNIQCWVCDKDDNQWGNFVNGTLAPWGNGVFPSLPCCGGNSHHTIGWWGNPILITNRPLVLNISLPPGSTLSCCPFKIDFCIRYTFTDKECRSCSVVKCYEYIRQPDTSIIIDHKVIDHKVIDYKVIDPNIKITK